MSDTILVRVVDAWMEAEGVLAYALADCEGRALPAFTAGAHISIQLASGEFRQYSIANDPAEDHRYVIAVQREPRGRGGSIEIQDTISIGDRVQIARPINNFRLDDKAQRHVLIAGGIGITPMMAMAHKLVRCQSAWRLYYCARSPDKSAFRAALSKPPFSEHTVFHFDNGDPSRGIDLEAVLSNECAAGVHVYCCGPHGLMNAVGLATRHWPKGTVHFEYFARPQSEALAKFEGDREFEIELERSGKVLAVPVGTSILSVLQAHGVNVPSMCREGICGSCLTAVLEGVPDHRDQVLNHQERSQGKLIAICCSRSQSARLKLAL